MNAYDATVVRAGRLQSARCTHSYQCVHPASANPLRRAAYVIPRKWCGGFLFLTVRRVG